MAGLLSLVAAAIIAGLIGWLAARAIGWAFQRGHVPEYLKAPILLVAVIGVFVLSNLIQAETGLVTVTVMGVALANMKFDSLRDIQPFKENVTVLLISGVFVILSASLDLDVLRQVGAPALQAPRRLGCGPVRLRSRPCLPPCAQLR